MNFIGAPCLAEGALFLSCYCESISIVELLSRRIDDAELLWQVRADVTIMRDRRPACAYKRGNANRMNGQKMIAPLQLPAREIAVPASLSPQAQAVLGAPMPGPAPYPDLEDKAAWREYIADQDAALLGFVSQMPLAAAAGAVDVDEVIVGEARVFQVTPRDLRAADDCVYLDIHGGALIMGGGALCLTFAKILAARRGARVWSVDYRMPPDHPYPAGLEDCLAAYRALLAQYSPDRIVVGGGSAGGNLATAMLLRAREEGLPMPAGLILITPELDLTESGDSFQTNLGLDAVLTSSLMPANLLYADGADLSDPYVSPLFADFAGDFPPTLITAGTRDLFLSNAVRMHWALLARNIPAQLLILEAASHSGLPGTPESDLLDRELDRFCQAIWHGGSGESVAP